MAIWNFRKLLPDWITGGKENVQGNTFSSEYDDNTIKAILQAFEAKNLSSEVESPVKGGRSSTPEAILTGQGQITGVIAPKSFRIEDLKILEGLAIYNRHVSMAVENVVALSNTKCHLTFSDEFSESQKRAMEAHLEAVGSKWYGTDEGESSLDADRFVQVAVYGCVSTEAEIKRDLSGIKKVHRVSPEYIRFIWDKDKQDYIPVQLTTISSTGNGVYNILNTRQYNYFGLRRVSIEPYPMPPFISALEDIATENDMLSNFKSMMRRVGLLGFLTVLLKQPKQKLGKESDAQYQQRLESYLDKAESQVNKGFSNGYNIGFQDSTEFKIDGNKMNASAATDLMKITNQLVMSGLKQDPNLHGYQFSTSENFGKVIIQKMAKQSAQYQLAVAKDKANKACLELELAGFPPLRQKKGVRANPYGLKYEFETAINLNKKEDAETEKLNKETEKIHIENVLLKRDEGFISQNEAAKEVGYKTAFKKVPVKTKTGTESGNSLTRNGIKNNMFNYSIPEEYEITLFDGFEEDKYLNTIYSDYTESVKSNYGKVLSTRIGKLAKDISEMPKNTSSEVLFSVIESHLLSNWKKQYQEPTKKATKKYIPKVYLNYRTDKSIFGDSDSYDKFDAIPDGVFDLLDLRAIEYLEELDNVYLGKFITDEDTRKRFKTWISDYYLNDNSPVGAEIGVIESFLEEFGAEFNHEAWKIVRVISTTLNKVRNYANVLYIDQVNIEQFEIVEVMDRITCKWCRHLDGKTFSTSTAVKKIKRVVDGSTTDVGNESPFATTIKIEEFEKLDSKEIQNLGIDTPPYHPHCRGRVVAVIL